MTESPLFISFVQSLSKEDKYSLLNDPPSALFLFRLLPFSAQSTVFNLLWDATQNITGDTSKVNCDDISLLNGLHMIEYSNGHMTLESSFRRSYLRSILMGTHKCAGLMEARNDRKRKKEKDMEKKSAERWECVLRYLALPSEASTANVSQTTRGVFHSASFTIRTEGDIGITSAGFQFLLLSPVRQIWSYIIELFKLEKKEGRNVIELLHVLLRMAICVEGDAERKAFELHSNWNERQSNFVMHLRELGLIFMRKRKDGVFHLTSLMASIAAGLDEETDATKNGNIVVETNFRVYAYTSSPLQLAILSSFTQMMYRFNDMSVGVLCRDSVRQALQVGITANQIISFLRANAHAQSKSHSIPITVADQIRLWEDERKRLIYDDATLYSAFDSEQEYQDVVSFATRKGILLFSDSHRKCVVVCLSGHDLVKNWWKSRNNHPSS